MKVIIDLEKIDYGEVVEKLIDVGANNVGGNATLQKHLMTIMEERKKGVHNITNIIPTKILDFLVKVMVKFNKKKIMNLLQSLAKQQDVTIVIKDIEIK